MIKIGICGYGNLGRGVLAAIKNNKDMELVRVFTRRDPKTVKIDIEGDYVSPMDDILSYQDKIDVMILCGGSRTDLPVQTPYLAKYFNVFAVSIATLSSCYLDVIINYLIIHSFFKRHDKKSIC